MKDKKKLKENREEDCTIGPNEKKKGKVRNRQQDQNEEKTSREKCADTEIEIEKEEKTSEEKCADTEIQKRRRPQRKVCRHRK